MTAFPYAVAADAPLARALEMMAEHDIRHLPVTRAGRLASVVGRAEVALALEPREGGVPPERLTVGDVCSGEVYVVDVATPLDQVLMGMASRHADCAVVVKEERLAGIFTPTDACRTFAELLRNIYPLPDGDDAA
jgi:acetoin utilization protein AcuB